ncbi:transposase, partial [Schinkia azotoformans]
MKLPKELIKEMVKEQKFTSTDQIMETIKEMFSDVMEEVLQCEIEEQLGYEKHQRRSDEPSNYRNGSTKRKLKTQFGEVEVNVPRDRKGSYEPQILNKYQRNVDGLEEK